MAVSVSATLSDGTTTISMGDNTSYEITADGYGDGDIVSDNTYATSRWVDGAALISSRWEIASTTLRIRVKGSSTSDLYSKINSLVSLVSSFSYTLAVTVGGATRTYDCLPASVQIGDGGAFTSVGARNTQQIVTITIPRQPNVS